MKIFRGYALIRVGTLAINTTYPEGVRLLGVGTIFLGLFSTLITSFNAQNFAYKPTYLRAYSQNQQKYVPFGLY